MGPYKPLLLGWWVYPLLYGNNGSWSTLAHISHTITNIFSALITKQLRNDLPDTTHTASNANVESTSEIFRVDVLAIDKTPVEHLKDLNPGKSGRFKSWKPSFCLDFAKKCLDKNKKYSLNGG